MSTQKILATEFGRLMALLLAVAPSACGGGGSGVGSNNPAAVAPGPAPWAAPAVVTVQPAFTFQQANDTPVTYQPASATALVTNAGTGGTASAASGQGATITITDAGGWYAIVLNIPTTGTTFTQQFAVGPWDYGGYIYGSAFTAADLVASLQNIFGSPNTTNAIITQSIGAQSLNYAAYGLWASGDTATAGRAGTFAFGSLTPTASVPSTGSATFNGITIGIGGATAGSTVYALLGNAQIIANFATQSVTANLTNLSTQNILTNAVGSLPNLSGTSTISGNSYAGPIAGTGLTGTINGNFYGPAAQETAGVWQASGGGNAWLGSYGAK
jgi:hypothetical protein